ncbi:MAG TPA: hypothetical protein VLL52_07270 [Anaerolineae bacterium]|nr:hypothetical protein [Anaerolineae bacterium]
MIIITAILQFIISYLLAFLLLVGIGVGDFELIALPITCIIGICLTPAIMAQFTPTAKPTRNHLIATTIGVALGTVPMIAANFGLIPGGIGFLPFFLIPIAGLLGYHLLTPRLT